MRESLFNILQYKIVDARVLDMFCGTGAVGIEALSRGAKEVVFNDKSRESLIITKKNLEKLGIDNGISVINRDYSALFEMNLSLFDVVFIDPPYASDAGVLAIAKVDKLLVDGGIAVFESETPWESRKILDLPKGLVFYDERKYGRVYLTFFRKEN